MTTVCSQVYNPRKNPAGDLPGTVGRGSCTFPLSHLHLSLRLV